VYIQYANATTKSQDICKVLSTRNVSITAVSPNEPNVKYTVIQKLALLEEAFAPLVDKVKLSIERTIIFDRTHDATSMIYLYIHESQVTRGIFTDLRHVVPYSQRWGDNCQVILYSIRTIINFD